MRKVPSSAIPTQRPRAGCRWSVRRARCRHRVWSRSQSDSVNVVVVLPSGVSSLRGLRVAFALHGSGENAVSTFYRLHLDRCMAAVAPAFALVAVDGGADGYWHPRSGADPLRMMVDEVLPFPGRRGARTDRFAAIGWSMGGYGALLGEQVGAPRMAAVVASSPAIFASYEDARGANRRAFDDEADFRRHDILAGLGKLRDVPSWVDCGTSDPFARMTRRLRADLKPQGGAMSRGCHDLAYWSARLPGQLAFLATVSRSDPGRSGLRARTAPPRRACPARRGGGEPGRARSTRGRWSPCWRSRWECRRRGRRCRCRRG